MLAETPKMHTVGGAAACRVGQMFDYTPFSPKYILTLEGHVY